MMEGKREGRGGLSLGEVILLEIISLKIISSFLFFSSFFCLIRCKIYEAGTITRGRVCLGGAALRPYREGK